MSETLPQLPAGEGAPDALGVVEGWRSWRFHPALGLRSIFAPGYWPAQKEMVAWCPHGLYMQAVRRNAERGRFPPPRKHSSPTKGCRCGIYVAAKGNWSGIPQGTIYGKAKLWGTVIRGTKAHRGQYAYPSELYAPDRLLKHPALLAYGVPVRQYKEMPWLLRLRRRLRIRIDALILLGLWTMLATTSAVGAATGSLIPYLGSVAIILACATVVFMKG